MCVYQQTHVVNTSKVLFIIYSNQSSYPLVMMQSSHPQIWRNLGVILLTCGGINDRIVVSVTSNFCVTKSTTLSKPSLSDGFITSLCWSLTYISINFVGKTSFWFDSGLKTVKKLLDTHDGLTLVWDSIHSTISSLNRFVIVLYIKRPLIYFRFFLPSGAFLLSNVVLSLPNYVISYNQGLLLSLSVLL